MNPDTSRATAAPVAVPTEARRRSVAQMMLRWSNVGVIILLFGISPCSRGTSSPSAMS
jgi:hypothetical protein